MAPSAVTQKAYVDLAADFAAGRETPRQVLDRCLSVLEEREKDIHAFVATRLDAARAEADAATARWREGKPLSAVDGMPVGIKDIIETADLPTQMGSPYFEGFQPNRDSATVDALREAGAVIVGKTVTTEFAATHPGPTRNPFDLARTPGGSSSGSAAATGAGMLWGALGTQVVGSILRPASYCGVWGFKPSLGGLNRSGSHDHMSQSSAGTIARTRADAWQIAREIVVRVGGDPGYAGLDGPATAPMAKMPARIALLQTAGWAKANAAARAGLETIIGKLKAAGVEIISRQTNATLEAVEGALQEAMSLTRAINAFESRWPLNTYARLGASKLSANMIDRLHESRAMTLADYRNGLARRDDIRKRYAEFTLTAPVCLTLSASDVAPMGLESTGDPTFAVPSSLLGVPALSMPLLSVGELPLGVQALGRQNHDADLFAAAAAIESAVSGN